MTTTNFFDTLGNDLSSIKTMVSEISQRLQELEGKPAQKDIGGIEIAMEITGLSKGSIYRHVGNNAIPFSRVNGRLYFSRRSLLQWITTNGSQD